jgi:hypothetical protein
MVADAVPDSRRGAPLGPAEGPCPLLVVGGPPRSNLMGSALVVEQAVVLAEPVAYAAGTVGVVERAVVGESAEVADQVEQFRPAVMAGLWRWDSGAHGLLLLAQVGI